MSLFPLFFFNSFLIKKKFPNLFNESNNNQKLSPSSSFDENDKISIEPKQTYPDNTEQILQLTNDLHQAFRLVTQKKAELEREQQKFFKEKKNFAREKARYESEQIFADTEAGNSASYMLLNQKYKALKDKYKFKKNEWQKEKQQYINQISMLNEKIKELTSHKDFSPNRTNSIAHFDTSSDSELLDDKKAHENSIKTNVPQNTAVINNDARDNPFNLINISPSMKSKQPQNKANQNINENIVNNTDFKKLSFDGSDNDSENDQFDIIEDNNINYNSNNLYMPPNSNKVLNANPQNINQDYQHSPQIKNFNINPQFENQENQLNSQSKQLSPQIPDSLKSEPIDFVDPIEDKKIIQNEQKENKFTAFRNWDDYDYSDSYIKNQNENDMPKIEKPLVFRAVIPKGSQNSNNGSRIDSSPPLVKKSKYSGESSILNSKLKNQKNEISNKAQKTDNKAQKIENKVQKKFSPQTKKKASKFDVPQKKVAPNNENEIVSNSPDDSTIQKRISPYPPLFNMNDPKNNNQSIASANVSNSPIGSPSKDKKASFSIFENYDVNFDVNLGEIIEEKNGANKKKIIKYFDGSTEVIFPNGTRKVTRSNCVYVFYQNGDISQDFNDGARAYKYSNGTIDLTLPNGIILCVFPNGQREKHFLNGDKEIIYPTGETKYLKASA